jgi:hemerythrin superfamily protein
MDVIDLIESDHREVEALFAKFAKTDDGAIAIQICDAIDRHAIAEAIAVYPVIAAEVPNGVQMAGEGEDEHAEARRLVDEVRRTSSSERRRDLMRELAMVVEEHVDVEETEVLPQAKVILGPDRLHSVGVAFEAAKRAARPESIYPFALDA